MAWAPEAFEARFPQRATRWQLRTQTLEFGRLPALMGIINVTPDSFSDGGQFYELEVAVDHALQLAADGADILDVGGESTRPYSDSVAVEEELARVVPLVETLAKKTKVPISIDTSKAIVAKAALLAGAEIINDVTGLTGDPDMIEVARDTGAAVCAMHMQGTPQTMQDDPQYQDLIGDILTYLDQRRNVLSAAEIVESRICLDPGIGFGKTHQHNFTLMAHCYQFHKLGCPLLVGHSRKGFLSKLLAGKSEDRTDATIGSALTLALQGVQVIRVHEVRGVRDALLAFEATGGLDGREIVLADESADNASSHRR